MRITVDYGRAEAGLDIADENLIPLRAPLSSARLDDPAAAVAAALEQPNDFPPLRRALTPDDAVVVVIDERLPGLTTLLVPVLEHITSAGITPDGITLLCAPPTSGQPWLEELPESLEEVRCEVHDPTDRKRLSYVSTTRRNRPFYFNRSAVDAAQLVVLTGRRFDPLHGHGGGAGTLFPVFSDAESRTHAAGQLSHDVPSGHPWPAAADTLEASWLLGAPFFVQIVEGNGDDTADVIAGVATSLDEGRRRLEARWRRTMPRRAELAVATLRGDPRRHGLDAMADAVFNAARVVRPGGRIVLLTEGRFGDSPSLGLLKEAEDSAAALVDLSRRMDLDFITAWKWASAAGHASLFVHSPMQPDLVEDLFATPIVELTQLQRLLAISGGCVVIEDAHKTLPVVEDGQ